MSMDRWNQEVDAALTRLSHEVSGLAEDAAGFFNALSLVEKSLLGGLGVLMLSYMLLPGGRGEGAGAPSGKYFAGVLLLFVAAGVLTGLMMSGRISL